MDFRLHLNGRLAWGKKTIKQGTRTLGLGVCVKMHTWRSQEYNLPLLGPINCLNGFSAIEYITIQILFAYSYK